MTLIAVFNDSQHTHLISDSLITCTVKKDTDSTVGEWLSTGVYLDGKDLLRYRYIEGVLKIWSIQSNLAIGLAGCVSLATSLLEVIANESRITPFESYDEFVQYVLRRAFPSISPFRGSCCLCGFFDHNRSVTKFVISVSDKDGVHVKSTNDPSEHYTVGTGSKEFIDIWTRLRNECFADIIDPTLAFSVIAEHLYLNQFLRKIEVITERYTGGAISGVYSSHGNLAWQPSRSIVAFANRGGTGLDARFDWLPIVYKTWHENGNVFSSSMFEQNGDYYQRITQYSNLLSQPFTIAKTSALPSEMKTFNAKQIAVILLPKGISNEFPAVIRASGRVRAFDEILEGGRIVGLRPNRDFFQQIEKRFFVCDDSTIKIGIESFLPRIESLRRRLDSYTRESDPTKWVQTQGELAVSLMTYGGKTNDIGLLSEALGRLLDAHQTARIHRLSSLNAAQHNVEQFMQDMHRNLNASDVARVIGNNKDAFNQYVNSRGRR